MLTTESLIVVGTCSLIGLIVLSAVWAWSWKNWLELKHHQLNAGAAGPIANEDRPSASIGNRIELADLRERVKKLEAIAAGVDL